MAFQDLRGAMGREVVVRTRAGLAVRGKPRYRYPMNAEVALGANRMTEANAQWNTLTRQDVALWEAYASQIIRRDPVSMTSYSPTAKNAFIGLALKFLQVNPGQEAPRVPPASDFVGDPISLTAEAIPSGIRFLATGPNSAGVLTELLAQRLKNERCRPGKQYKSLGFHAFDGAPYEAPFEPGVYALAMRFVRASTGQATDLLLLGEHDVFA